MGDFIDGLARVFKLVLDAPVSGTLSVIGLILLFTSGVFAYQAIKREPKDTPPWFGYALFSTLIAGIAFSAAGPSLALLRSADSSNIKTSIEQALAHLEQNKEVQWLVRLVVSDSKGLDIANLKRLGPPKQQFTFVASYEDLAGYTAQEVMRMTGGTYKQGQRISAVIFPLLEKDLYPASARGLLQVIRRVEANPQLTIDRPFLRDTMELNNDQIADLENTHITTYRFDYFKSNYKQYCELTHRFRCDTRYTAHDYIGGLNFDWHPLGSAQRDATPTPCKLPKDSFCEIPDWRAARAALSANFGSRAFMMENQEIEKIPNRILVDFSEPTRQIIPFIGVRR
jgi:hypothetical protein